MCQLAGAKHLNAVLLMAYEHTNGLTSFINVYDTELRRRRRAKNAVFLSHSCQVSTVMLLETGAMWRSSLQLELPVYLAGSIKFIQRK